MVEGECRRLDDGLAVACHVATAGRFPVAPSSKTFAAWWPHLLRCAFLISLAYGPHNASPVMNRPQQAVVLAAGHGSRMGHFTDDQPKCLPGRAPILEWTLQALKANGITKVLVIGGWQATALQPWCDVLRVHPRWAQTNMWCARSCWPLIGCSRLPPGGLWGWRLWGRALSAALGES